MPSRPRLTPEAAQARKAVRELLSTLKPKRLVLAVSGGADSLALAAATAFEAKKLSIQLVAAVIDHGLQKGSDQVAKQAAERLQVLGIDDVVIEKVSVKKSGDGLEAAARDARYQALEKIRKAKKAEWILLGHNLDDQAETVLLGLARGSGLRSIAGMSKIDQERKLLRPLLDISRTDLRKACSDAGIGFWDDPHNEDSSFARVRVRKLAAELEKNLGPGFAQALSRTAKTAAEADEVIAELADKLIKKSLLKSGARQVSYAVPVLAKAKDAVRRKALHIICVSCGAKNVSRSQVLALDELITNWHGQKKSSLSGITVERVANQLVVKSTKPNKPGAC
ncbi:MAG: tRNA lysidine(34) synthetase TilS [Actinomycetota bacterium]